jgi:hypothetical protein
MKFFGIRERPFEKPSPFLLNVKRELKQGKGERPFEKPSPFLLNVKRELKQGREGRPRFQT